MKRFNKTAVALATAGAMTLAIVPNASAQDPVIDGNGNVTAGTNESAEDYGKSNEQPATEVGNSDNDAKNIDELLKDPNAVGTNRAEDEKGHKRAADSTNDMKPEDLPKGGIVRENGETFVEGNGIDNSKELNRGNIPFDKDEDGAETQGLTKGQIAGIVAGALAGTLIIGGIIYKLVKDKNGNPVYVPEDKAGQEPTAADKAASDKLISENADEIKRQTAAAEKNGEEVVQVGDSAADRGVGAATGNNTIAKGLVGLLIASIMGAAAFAFGRRRLV